MATIDDKVVAMSFESSKFESGVNSTISSIDKLKQALKFPHAGDGLNDINEASKKVDFGFIHNAIESVKGALGSLRLVGIGVLTHIANTAVDQGAKFVKAFTIDPAKAGYSEYSTNLNAVQTILANTQAAGTKLPDVNKALKELNDYSDKTIYNFSEMAKNIGTFTAAGVDLDTATGAIKGIANLAALSGSNSEQASTAMYQLSQAISAGKVGLQDWNSVVNAGMGGTVFQRALAQTAESMGTLQKGTVKLVGPMKNVSINGQAFRNSLAAKPGEQSWLTGEVLTKTLEQFTGDLSDAELASEGFTKAQIKAIQSQAATAQQAATQVKTLSQVIDVAKETAGSGWAQTWQIIFGDFGEAKKLFTDVSNAVNGFINASADARNKVLGDWKELGGRTVLIDAIKTAFHNLGLILAPIKEAFRDIFPAKTGQDLYDLTVRFKEFADALKPSPETVDNLKRTFKGLFALLDIGKQIVGGIFTVFGQLFGALHSGSGGFLDITAKIGDFLVKIDDALKKGDALHNFFTGLGAILAVPLKLLSAVGSAIGNLFGGFSSGGFSGQMSGMTAAMTPLQKVMEALSNAWAKFLDSFANTGTVLQPAIDAVAKLFQGLGPAIANAISSMNFEAILQVIRTGLFGGLVVMFKQFLGKGSFLEQISTGFKGGILANISGAFEGLNGTMKAMQQNLKAKTLKEIAIAIALLVASIVALSFVPADKLNSAMAAITIAFGQLIGAMALLDKVTKSAGMIKMPLMAASLILFAGAIDILAIAVFALSKLSWAELAKGLGGVTVLLVGLSAASGPLSKNSAGMIRAGVGIGALAVALKILASAVADFGGMSFTQLGKGLIGVGGGLVVIAAAAKALPPNMVLTGAGLIAVAAGLKILAGAVGEFGKMNWGTIGKGLVGIGGALVVIAGAMQLMPASMALTAAGLLLVALSLGKITAAIDKMGGMSVGKLAKGLISLALALGILAASMYAMSGALVGAAALTVAAAGLALLAPALATLGKLSWGQVLKGLVALAGAIAVLAGAAILLQPAIPAMLGFGAALVVIGAGLTLAGAGIALIGVGLSAIAVSGTSAIGILLKALEDLVASLIKMAKDLVLGLLEIVKALADTAPQFVDALVKIINSLLDAVIKASPKIAEAFQALLDAALKILKDNQGKIIQAGFDLIIALLKGIKDNISKVIDMVVNIIETILRSLANNLARIQGAGLDILLSFLKGIADNLSKVVTAAISIVTSFLSTIADNIGKIIAAGVSIITNFLQGIANSIGRVVSAAANIVVELVNTIADNYGKIINAGLGAVVRFVSGIADSIGRVISAGANIVGELIGAIADNFGKIVNAGLGAIVRFVSGISDNIERVVSAGTNLVTKFIGAIAESAQRIVNVGINSLTSFLHGLGDGGKLQQLANAGVTAISRFIDAIVTGSLALVDKGADAVVKFINGVAEAIRTHDAELGQAGGNLASAIVEGFATGLTSGISEVVSRAKDMAKGALSGIAHAAGIKSPSKVTYQFGLWFAEGFANGINEGSDDAVSAVTDMTDSVLQAMSSIPDVIDTSPVITPVLDLTAVQEGASRLTGIINTVPTVGITSTRQASIISSQQAGTAADQATTTATGPSVIFEQNNYSPEALSEIEIYRQTRNQLSQLKSALALT